MNNTTRWMLGAALALGACDAEPTTDGLGEGSGQLSIEATAWSADAGGKEPVALIAWELPEQNDEGEMLLQDLTVLSGAGQTKRLSLTEAPPALTLETDEEFLRGSFALGQLALGHAGHPMVVERPDKFAEPEGTLSEYTPVALNYAVIYVSEAQAAESYVAGYYNAYRPLAAGVHLIRFREASAAERRLAVACDEAAVAAALHDVNQKFGTAYESEDELYEVESDLDAILEQEDALDIGIDKAKIAARCALGKAVGEAQPAGALVDLRIDAPEPLVDWE